MWSKKNNKIVRVRRGRGDTPSAARIQKNQQYHNICETSSGAVVEKNNHETTTLNKGKSCVIEMMRGVAT